MTDNDPNEADAMMPMPIGPEPAARSPVNKITWAQVGLVSDPGRYMLKFGWLTVTADDLAIWKQHPSAAFTLLRTATTTQPGDEAKADEEFRLGTFELRENISLSEK
jgi:hypothetical protein